jgi:hypothetical protein
MSHVCHVPRAPRWSFAYTSYSMDELQYGRPSKQTAPHRRDRQFFQADNQLLCAEPECGRVTVAFGNHMN